MRLAGAPFGVFSDNEGDHESERSSNPVVNFSCAVRKIVCNMLKNFEKFFHIGSAKRLHGLNNLHGKWIKNPCVLCSAVSYCCGAVAPRAIAALLGRFLPRLGPLVNSGGPFFLSARVYSAAAWNGPR